MKEEDMDQNRIPKGMSDDYYDYDRSDFIKAYGDTERIDGGEIIDTDLQTVATQIMQMYIYGRILHFKDGKDFRTKLFIAESNKRIKAVI